MLVVSAISHKWYENRKAEREGVEVPHKETNPNCDQGIAHTLCLFLSRKENLKDFRWGNGSNCIVVDIWHSASRGRAIDYCRIGIEQNDATAGVRESNMIFELARIVHAGAYLLKSLPPPPRFKDARNINILKNYVHPLDRVEKFHLVRNPDGSPYEVVLVPREEKPQA